MGEFEVFNDEGTTGRRQIPTEDKKNLLNKFLYNWETPFHLNAMLIKKSLLKQIGPFDERLLRGQEQDYAIRILKMRPDVVFIHNVVYSYRKYRPLGKRLRVRLASFTYALKLTTKHTSGWEMIVAVGWKIILEGLKFIYELFGNYKR